MIGLNYLGKMGQLGNQMFQYAALKGIANNRGLEYTVPNHKEVLEDGLGNKLRIELYDAFDINPKNQGLLPTNEYVQEAHFHFCLLYTSPSPRDRTRSRMPSSA